MNQSAPPTAPYKGLIPYSEEDQAFFFGRDPECEIITANLMAFRLTLLYGSSGVGKSSVLRAGVEHHLRELARKNLAKRGKAEFAVVVFSAWRDNPLTGLAAQVQDSVAQTLGDRAERVSISGNFADILETSAERTNGHLLIILDQFEEYFLYHAQEDGAGSFAVEFPKAINNPALPVNFMISMREDALAKLDRFEGRIPNLFENFLRIEHLDRNSAREAIVQPIEEYNRLLAADCQKVSIEPALVEEALNQVRTGQVVLGEAGRGVVEAEDTEARIETPFLQLVMTRLWNEEMRAGSHVLRLETLKNLGGAERIIKTHLDEAMRGLSDEGQDVAARIFRYLVTPSGTKIAYPIGDLAEYGGLRQQQLAPVIEELSSGENRILRPVAPPPNDQGPLRYEIFHDVLASAILDWRSRYAQEQERAESKKQLEKEQKRVRRQRLVLLVMGVLLLGVVGLAVYAFSARADSKRQQKIAQSRDLAASAISQLTNDPELSLLLATEAVETAPTEQAVYALRQSLYQLRILSVMRGHTERVRGVGFSPDGNQIVTASQDNTAKIWDASTGKNLIELKGHKDWVIGATFSPDGNQVATASLDKTARIWDAKTGQEMIELPHNDYVWSVAYSPDGKYVATGSNDHIARVWDVMTGKMTVELSGHVAGVRGVGFSPDGERIVTASEDRDAIVWNAKTGKSLKRLSRLMMGEVWSAAFSPDGSKIATGSFNNKVSVWDANTYEHIFDLSGHTAAVWSVAFSPDGRYLVTASADNTARVWDMGTFQTVVELGGHAGTVTGAVFSRDGKRIATGSYDKTARVWNAEKAQMSVELKDSISTVDSVEFSPDGKQILTGGSKIRVWDAKTGLSVVNIDVNSSPVRATYSPDGKRIAAAIVGTLSVWDVGSGQIIIDLPHKDFVRSVAYSPNGEYVATVYGTIAQVWDIESRKITVELKGHTEPVRDVGFSPDGKRLVTASDDDTARVWEAETGQSLILLEGHRDIVLSAVFSPDGKRIVTGSGDGTGRVWNVETGQSMLVLVGHSGQVWDAAFSPDGKYIVTAGSDSTTRIWEANTGRSLVVLGGHTGPVTSVAISPDSKYIATASEDGTALIYTCEVCGSIEEVLELARARVTRKLTDEERRYYLPGSAGK